MVLIGYWPLNETSGSTAYDHSSRENRGTPKNGAGPSGTGTTNAPAGTTAYKFDGTDDYVDLGSPPSIISNLSTGSISFWFKTDGSTINVAISLSDSSDDSSNLGIQTANNGLSGNPFEFLVREGGTTLLSAVTDSSYDDQNWHHAVVVVNGSGNDIYIDGKKPSLTYRTGSSSTSEFFSSVSTPDTLYIGANKDSSGNRAFHSGPLSEMRIYNHALIPHEIQYLYTVGKQGRLTTNKKRS